MSNYIDRITLNGETRIIKDGTLESKEASQNGTDVSLVTTGEKYLWNHKGDGAVTSVTMNGEPVPVVSGAINLGTVITDVTDKLSTSLKGAANGLAELGPDGKVPANQLPSFVDDVLEYNGLSNFPATGESDKIYVDTATNKTYRWSGSSYSVIGSDVALGETASTAYRGDRGKAAYDHATDAGKVSSGYNSGLYKIAVTQEGHIASVSAVQKSDLVALGVADSPVTDVQINNTSIVIEGTANIPRADASNYGVVKINATYGINLTGTNNPVLSIERAENSEVKAGWDTYKPIVPFTQHMAAFYGLAKAAGDTTQALSSNATGVYTDDAKVAIRTMIGAGSYTKPNTGIPATDLADGILDGKIDSNVVVDEYDPLESYSLDDYSYHEGKLYRAKGTTTGSWDSTSWDEVNVMGELVARSAIQPAAGRYF